MASGFCSSLAILASKKYVSTGGPEETNSQNEIESERAEFKTLAIINIYNL